MCVRIHGPVLGIQRLCLILMEMLCTLTFTTEHKPNVGYVKWVLWNSAATLGVFYHHAYYKPRVKLYKEHTPFRRRVLM